MNTPLVSIIVPIYNSESYIAATVSSCLSQTYAHFELILVNDGSTDGTEAIIQQFADSRIRYFKVSNAGACNARNFGIDKAKGQLIQFLDHDDMLDERKLAIQVDYYRLNGDEFLYSGTMGTVSGETKTVDYGYELFQKNFKPQQFFEEKYTQFGMDIVTGAWLIPRRLVQSTHGWNPAAGLNDDGEYFMRIILNSKGIIYCDGAIFYFRRDVPNSLSKQFDNREVYKKWLHSYELYVQTFLQKLKPESARELGWKALSIFYCNSYPYYSDLREKCRSEMAMLGYRYPFPYGGRLFVKVAKLIGVDNALWFSSWKNKLIKPQRYKELNQPELLRSS